MPSFSSAKIMPGARVSSPALNRRDLGVGEGKVLGCGHEESPSRARTAETEGATSSESRSRKPASEG
jgi:hypothetical protein